MDGLIMAAQMIVALTILVTIHEYGHYITARMFGIRVDKFFVFFDAWGKKLFSFKKGDTEYGIGWLPLGGYVKIAGMIDESMDKEFLEKAPEKWEFRSKPAWQKLIVMLAGIFLNVVLGVLIYFGLNLANKDLIRLSDVQDNYILSNYGKKLGIEEGDILLGANGKEFERMKDVKFEVAFGGMLDVKRDGQLVQIPVPEDFLKTGQEFIYLKSETEIADLPTNSDEQFNKNIQKGDKILTVNGISVEAFQQFQEFLGRNKDGKIELEVLRNDQKQILPINVSEDGRIGFKPKVTILGEYPIHPLNVRESLKYGWKDAFDVIKLNLTAFGQIGKGKLNPKEAVGGPIKIATLFGAHWDWTRFWSLTGMLSMVLAFMNLLPIPALDGGHAVFAIIEMITGKPINQKVLEIAQMIGFFLLMGLMVFIFGNDIIGLIKK